jgi:hypothetical protein
MSTVLDDLLRHLGRTRAALFAAADTVPPDRQGEKPAPDAWSVAEILEHLSIVESNLLKRLAAGIDHVRGAGAPADESDAAAPIQPSANVLDRSQRRNAPAPIQPTGTVDATAARARLEETRRELERVIEAGRGLALSTVSFPLAGGHEERHAAQIAEVARHFAPPAAPPLDPGRILQTGLGFWPAKTLLSAIELELFTRLVGGSASLAEVESALGLHARSSRDFLDTLVALGFLNRQDDRYSNTPETDLFLDKNKPSYIGGILEMANARLYRFWGDLTDGLRTGLPQNEIKTGMPGLFEGLYSDPARLRGFLTAMTGLSHGANLTIAHRFPWKHYSSFVDVGTAQGDLATQVAVANPHLRGLGFDLPPVAPIFSDYVAAAGVADRLTFVVGDFFKDAFPQADVVMMGHILHDWDLPTKRMLIGKAFDALPSGGALIVYEAIIDDERRANAFGLMMSLNMLIETPGGFDYTGADCAGWMKDAGFTSTRVEPLVGPDSMVVAIK